MSSLTPPFVFNLAAIIIGFAHSCAVIVMAVPQDGLSAFDDLAGFNFSGKVHPGKYADQLWIGRGVSLSPEQFQLRNEIFNDLINDFDGLGTEEFNERYYERLEAILTPDQKSLLTQAIAREYFNQTIVKDTPEFAGIADLYWMHQDLRQALSLRQEQIKEVERRLKEWRSNAPDEKGLQESYEAIYTEWQQRLEDVLLTRQIQLYRDTTGETFEFGNSLNALSSIAYSGGEPLFVTRDRVVHEFRGRIPSLVTLLRNEQRLDGVLDWYGTVALLSRSVIQEELKLSVAQLEAVKKWHDEMLQQHPLPDFIQIGFRARGVALEPDELSNEDSADHSANRHGNTTLTTPSDHWDQEQQRTLDRILNSQQVDRLRQLKNQFILQLGWREVPLMFPDWPEYLGLSDSQQTSFAEINQEMENRYRKLQIAYREAIRKYRTQILDFKSILDDSQRARLVLLFGPFS